MNDVGLSGVFHAVPASALLAVLIAIQQLFVILDDLADGGSVLLDPFLVKVLEPRHREALIFLRPLQVVVGHTQVAIVKKWYFAAVTAV